LYKKQELHIKYLILHGDLLYKYHSNSSYIKPLH